MSTTVAPEKRTIPGRKHLIAAAVVVVTVTAAVAGVRWWTVGRFIESTDDAYVRADVVTMSSHVPGYVSEVAVQDDQRRCARLGRDPVTIVQPKAADLDQFVGHGCHRRRLSFGQSLIPLSRLREASNDVARA